MLACRASLVQHPHTQFNIIFSRSRPIGGLFSHSGFQARNLQALPVSLMCMSLNSEVRTLDFKLTYALTSYLPSVTACSGAIWFQNLQFSLIEGLQ